jgi:hypothetical protein
VLRALRITASKCEQSLQMNCADMLAVLAEDSIDECAHRIEAAGLIGGYGLVVKARCVDGFGWLANRHD